MIVKDPDWISTSPPSLSRGSPLKSQERRAEEGSAEQRSWTWTPNFWTVDEGSEMKRGVKSKWEQNTYRKIQLVKSILHGHNISDVFTGRKDHDAHYSNAKCRLFRFKRNS